MQQPGDCIYLTYDCAPFNYYKMLEFKSTTNKFLPEEIYPYPLTQKNLGNIVNGYKRMWLNSNVNKKYEEIEMIRFVLGEKFHLQEKHIIRGYGINSRSIVSELYVKN